MSLQIIAPYAPLYCKPCPAAERDDEIWFGQGVEVLEELEDGWLRVRTCYGYESYLEARYVGEEPQGEPLVVRSPWADVLAAPKHQAQLLLTLPRGSRVRAWGESKGWTRVALPGAGVGYIKEAHLGPLPQPKAMEESQLRAQLVDGALAYLDCPYRWGGRTPAGVDCSGLCHTAYLLQGIPIYRNSRLAPSYGVREIPREACQAGDLLYFPGHMAMYLGGDRFVHASARAGKVCCGSLRENAEGYWADLAERLFCIGSIFPL